MKQRAAAEEKKEQKKEWRTLKTCRRRGGIKNIAKIDSISARGV
jgi:hypothetical protein